MHRNNIPQFKKRSCKYKNKHEHLKYALTAMFCLRERGIDVDCCYKCVFCNFYHLGHYGNVKRRTKNKRIIREYLKMKGESHNVIS